MISVADCRLHAAALHLLTVEVALVVYVYLTASLMYWSGMAMDMQTTGMPSFEQSFLDPNPMLPAHTGSFPGAFPAPASTAF